MKRFLDEHNKFLIQGGKYGVVSSIIGALFFGLLQGIIVSWDARDIRDFLLFGITAFLVGSIMALIPAFMGGYLLAFILLGCAIKEKLHALTAIVIGIVIGGLAGAGICWFVGLNSFNHANLNRLLAYVCEATLIASVAGGWTGRKLGNNLLIPVGNHSL